MTGKHDFRFVRLNNIFSADLNDFHRALVHRPAVGLAEVAEDPPGGLAEDLQDELHHRGVVVVEAKEVDQAGKDGLEVREELGRSVNVGALGNTWKK